MSKLTNEIQRGIDEAHERLVAMREAQDVTDVVAAILSAVELAVTARIQTGRLKADGPPVKGALAQLDLLDQEIFSCLRRALAE